MARTKNATPKKGQKAIEPDESGAFKDAPLGRVIEITQHHVKFVTEKMVATTKPDKASELRGLSSDEAEDWVREHAKVKDKLGKGEYDEQVDILVDMVRHAERYPCEVQER